MFTVKNEYGIDIYPFASGEHDAPFTKRISVYPDGSVCDIFGKLRDCEDALAYWEEWKKKVSEGMEEAQRILKEND